MFNVAEGDDCMATKSILKTVNIKERKMGHALVEALERSQDAKPKNVTLSKPCREAKGSAIRELFGEYK